MPLNDDRKRSAAKAGPKRAKLFLSLPRIALAVAALCCAMAPARAAQQSAPFQTQLSIVSGCAVSVPDLDFGQAPSLDTAIQASTTVTVVCSRFTPYLLTLSPVSIRRTITSAMLGPGDPIQYQLTLSGMAGFGSRTFRVDGTVPAQPTPLAGTYTDTQRVYVIY